MDLDDDGDAVAGRVTLDGDGDGSGDAKRLALRRWPRGRTAARAAPISSAPAQVRERKLGDLFEYEIEHPVTIRRNQSALVPIVLREFEGRPVLLYNKQNRAENPMRCVEFKNTTGLTLEGGPVTVLEGGSYVGEAMLETLKPDETRLVPFAVELGVKVLDNVESRNEHVSRVVISKGTLVAYYAQVATTTYLLDNKGDAPGVVYLEHPREGADWTLVEPATAHEVTESYWRFRFDLAPSGVTRFVVRKQRRLIQRHALADAPTRQLELWIDQRYLDAASEAVLRQALELRRKISDAEAIVRRLEAERQGDPHRAGTDPREPQVAERSRRRSGSCASGSSGRSARRRIASRPSARRSRRRRARPRSSGSSSPICSSS